LLPFWATFSTRPRTRSQLPSLAPQRSRR
jgi:hypothetical protein